MINDKNYEVIKGSFPGTLFYSFVTESSGELTLALRPETDLPANK